MSISQLFVIAAIAFLVGQMKKGRSLVLLGVSAFLIYWLQPVQESISLTFWLPTATLTVTVLVWLLTSTPEVRGWRQNLPSILILTGVILLLDLNRYFQFEGIFISTTPRLQWIIGLFAFLLAFTILIAPLRQLSPVLFILAALAVILLFIFVKVPFLLNHFIDALSSIRGKPARGSLSLSWLGFSYVVFRLLHTIFDRQAGRLPPVPLRDYVNYVIFFPAFAAGPIDRLERFMGDVNQPATLGRESWLEVGQRLGVGLFKKFVIADALAWIALNEVFAQQINSAACMWVLLYCYSLRIYFDFSGYTDIAIGLGMLLGVRLPENFAFPYLKPNLAQFWNSWHMTLTQWFRSYFFNPLTRALRAGEPSLPPSLMILIVQVSTMVLIGLWHGVTVGFVLWGVWHGLGLFIQNRWSNYMKGHTPAWGKTLAGERALKVAGIFLTFNFVSLGWLFFTLSTPARVWTVMAVLFGVS